MATAVRSSAGAPPAASSSSVGEFSKGKTIFVLAVVIGCFAILWPKIFYPMLTASLNVGGDDGEQCCDVISDQDVNAYKLVKEICGNILNREDVGGIPRDVGQGDKKGKRVYTPIPPPNIRCRNEIMRSCGIDVIQLIQENPMITKQYKISLAQLRSYNTSQCLKLHYSLDFQNIGLPRRFKDAQESPSHMRPERPIHFTRPEAMHPAMREKGSAIPHPAHPGIAPGVLSAHPQRTLEKEARPGPFPGVRPPIGGAGYQASQPKGGGTMGIIMPIYTIAIVVFFVYTIMKILFRKSDDKPPPMLKEFGMDPDHRKFVFAEEYQPGSERSIKEPFNKDDRESGIRRRPSKQRFQEQRSRLEEDNTQESTLTEDLSKATASALSMSESDFEKVVCEAKDQQGSFDASKDSYNAIAEDASITKEGVDRTAAADEATLEGKTKSVGQEEVVAEPERMMDSETIEAQEVVKARVLEEDSAASGVDANNAEVTQVLVEKLGVSQAVAGILNDEKIPGVNTDISVEQQTEAAIPEPLNETNDVVNVNVPELEDSNVSEVDKVIIKDVLDIQAAARSEEIQQLPEAAEVVEQAVRRVRFELEENEKVTEKLEDSIPETEVTNDQVVEKEGGQSEPILEVQSETVVSPVEGTVEAFDQDDQEQGASGSRVEVVEQVVIAVAVATEEEPTKAVDEAVKSSEFEFQDPEVTIKESEESIAAPAETMNVSNELVPASEEASEMTEITEGEPTKVINDQFKVPEEAVKAPEEAVKAQEEPVKAQEEPVKAQEEAVKATEEPVKDTDVPVTPSEEPVKDTDVPVTPSEEPVKDTDVPVTPSEEPAKATEEAMKLEKVLEVAEEPVKAPEKPIDASQEAAIIAEAVRMAEEQMKASEEQVQVAKELVQAAEELVKAAEEQVKAAEEPVNTTDEHVKAVEELVEAAVELVKAAEEQVKAAEEPVSTMPDQIKEEVITREVSFPAPEKEILKVSEEETNVPQEQVQALPLPAQSAEANEKIVIASEKPTEAPVKPVTAPEESTKPQDELLSADELIPQPASATSVPLSEEPPMEQTAQELLEDVLEKALMETILSKPVTEESIQELLKQLQDDNIPHDSTDQAPEDLESTISASDKPITETLNAQPASLPALSTGTLSNSPAAPSEVPASTPIESEIQIPSSIPEPMCPLLKSEPEIDTISTESQELPSAIVVTSLGTAESLKPVETPLSASNTTDLPRQPLTESPESVQVASSTSAIPEPETPAADPKAPHSGPQDKVQPSITGARDRDARDVEIDLLRKRLEETEAAMERIVSQMGTVSERLSPSPSPTNLAPVLQPKRQVKRSKPALKKTLVKASSEDKENQGSGSSEGVTKKKEVKILDIPSVLERQSSAEVSEEEVEAEEVEIDDEDEEEEEEELPYRPPTPPKSKKHVAVVATPPPPVVSNFAQLLSDRLLQEGESQAATILSYESRGRGTASPPLAASVVNVEGSLELENGRKLRSPTPPNVRTSSMSPLPPPVPSAEAQEERGVPSIYLKGRIPALANKVLVSGLTDGPDKVKSQVGPQEEAEEEAEEESLSVPVVLSGKVTLSVIAGIPDDQPTEAGSISYEDYAKAVSVQGEGHLRIEDAPNSGENRDDEGEGTHYTTAEKLEGPIDGNDGEGITDETAEDISALEGLDDGRHDDILPSDDEELEDEENEEDLSESEEEEDEEESEEEEEENASPKKNVTNKGPPV